MAATFFSQSLTSILIIMFFLGFSGVGRMSLCILYLLELIPSKSKAFCGNAVVLNNAATYLLCALYFWQISQHWEYLEYFAAGMTLLCIFVAVFLPESPKYLLTKKKYEQAHQALNLIAKVNGAP